MMGFVRKFPISPEIVKLPLNMFQLVPLSFGPKKNMIAKFSGCLDQKENFWQTMEGQHGKRQNKTVVGPFWNSEGSPQEPPWPRPLPRPHCATGADKRHKRRGRLLQNL